jgi:hypothetical protein
MRHPRTWFVFHGFLVTFFSFGIFHPPFLLCLTFFPFSPYTTMAPSSRTFLSPYYCELCDKTLVSNANLEEHNVGTIHRGLSEASMKMMGCQLQMFRKDLKVDHRRQKLPAKGAILCDSRWNPKIGVFHFFSQLCFIACFFFLPFFYFCFSPNDSVRDQNYIDLLFPLACRNIGLK